MVERNDYIIPINNSLISNIYNEYRAASGTLDGNIIESGLVKKINTGLTSESNVGELIHQNETRDTYRTTFASSFDSVFSPYTTYFSASGTPKFERPTTLGVPNSLTLNPFNPNNSLSLYYAPTGSLLYSLSSATTGTPTAAELALQSGADGWLQNGHNISWSVGVGILMETQYQVKEMIGLFVM
jgi:hypothetical protein